MADRKIYPWELSRKRKLGGSEVLFWGGATAQKVKKVKYWSSGVALGEG